MKYFPIFAFCIFQSCSDPAINNVDSTDESHLEAPQYVRLGLWGDPEIAKSISTEIYNNGIESYTENGIFRSVWVPENKLNESRKLVNDNELWKRQEIKPSDINVSLGYDPEFDPFRDNQ